MSAPAKLQPVTEPETPATIIERVIAAGDLARLTPEQRVEYYAEVCRSCGLNPLTRPFDYITLNGRLTLYPTRGATDQLRAVHRINTEIVSREQVGDLYVVHVRVTAPDGRRDEDVGIVATAGLRGEALANAVMKAITKAKRRATLSLLGLNMPDETEVETIPSARPALVDVETGEIIEAPAAPPAGGAPGGQPGGRAMRALHAAARGKFSHEELSALAGHIWGIPSLKAANEAQLRELQQAVEECRDEGSARAFLGLAAAVGEAAGEDALQAAANAVAKAGLGNGARLRLLRIAYARAREAIETQPDPGDEQGESGWEPLAAENEPGEPEVSWTALWRAFEPLGIRGLADAARALGVSEAELRGCTPGEVRRRLLALERARA